MEPSLQIDEPEKAALQDLPVKVPNVSPLPAGGPLTEQSQELKEHLPPRFIR